jgi:predicted Zn-dependent protease
VKKSEVATVLLVVLLGGCASIPKGTYFPEVMEPATIGLSESIYRAAVAAGDDPGRYSFALVKTTEVAAYTAADATFYFSDGFVGLPNSILEPIIAQKVAHEVLGHVGARKNLSMSITAGFTAVGILLPGVGLVDLIVNPLIVQAYSRDQEIKADAKALEILAVMGYESPRRALARALTTIERANGAPQEALAFSAEPRLQTRLDSLAPLEPPGLFAATATDGILSR